MNKAINKQLGEAIEVINKSKNIFIASHINPDGDNLGSMLALGLALKKIGKKTYFLKSDDTPKDFKFLPSINLLRKFEELNEKDIDVFIAVDSSDLDRLGRNKDYIQSSNNVINIDHHISNTNFGNINIVDPKASATGELIFDLIKAMDIELDEDIATCIYTAISTDTGSFKYESVTYRTHEIVAQLIKVGINKKNININLYESRSMERTRLFIKALSDLRTYNKDQIAAVKIKNKMLEETKSKMEDTEGIVSFIREIDSVEVACLLKEVDENETRISLRSKNFVDVASICNVFDGGGHVRAAGCTIYQGIDIAESLIVEEIKKAFR